MHMISVIFRGGDIRECDIKVKPCAAALALCGSHCPPWQDVCLHSGCPHVNFQNWTVDLTSIHYWLHEGFLLFAPARQER